MTDQADLARVIDAAWEDRAEIGPTVQGAVRAAVAAVIDLLDEGRLRVASPDGAGGWTTHEWIKKAVLLSFRLEANRLVEGAPGAGPWWDKVPGKTTGWTGQDFTAAGFRTVPGAVVRRGAFVDRNVVLMPSFVNIGAHIGEGAMIDTWATVGSCAQIGRNVHISGGAGIGGVLEPLQAAPVIIEDDVFIGARSEVAEGVIVRQGAVLSMGVFLGASTKIVDRASGTVYRGEAPAYSVIVPGSLPDPSGGPSLACAVIVKRVDAQTRAKTAINELLRD
jgi:2,3,4,5-tetrahydropyridine-2-carboxylate N-succinyltransferase